MTKKIILLLLVLPFFAFMQSGCENNSNAQQEVEEMEALAVDFLQNIISGSVGEKISENEYMFELTLSPNTVFTADMPRRKAGSITTENFYDNFDINFPESFPNAILSINEGAVPSAVPFEMKNPVFNPSTGVLEVIISPLETTTDAGEESVNLIDIGDIISPFGQSSLFIDDATNTCQGLVLVECSTGTGSGDNGQCALDGQCLDSGATCDGGSPGTCSVTGEDCASEECCTTGFGCLDAINIPL
ncbi:MAG: hypothetical protein IH964_10690 [Candidatus Dadabacteria bacterium]|nr:hypothetical protein [Candidatus Dadabacteria bacterium]